MKKSFKQRTEDLFDKFAPIPEKTYILTDQCFWEENPPENYNPYDSKRTPHAITLVDPETGTVVTLKSGSVVKVVSAR